jgi:hypothetical protein
LHRSAIIARDAGGLFSVPNKRRIFGWFTKWIIPYGFSSLLAGAAAHLTEAHEIGKAATIGVEWLAENAGYYFAAWYCQRFSTEEKVLDSGKESFKQLLIVEGFDSVVRISLFWLASELPMRYRPMGVVLATTIADVSFALTLNKSRRLLEICSRGCNIVMNIAGIWSSRPEPLVLH